MTQEAIQISETPPLPGLKLVQDVNKALQTIATDFAGPTDPAGLDGVGPYCTWADTANGLLKRRNAADTAWVVEGDLFTYKANRNGDAAQNFKAAPAAAAGDVVTFEQTFGVGQDWSNELPNRSPNVVYSNTTPAPISVYISFSVTVDGGCIVFWSGSAVLAVFERSKSSTTGGGWVVIPPGQQYLVEPQGSTILTWWEYR